jgi:cell division protein ZapA (FtsZ GTPase activity inhibitor)
LIATELIVLAIVVLILVAINICTCLASERAEVFGRWLSENAQLSGSE